MKNVGKRRSGMDTMSLSSKGNIWQPVIVLVMLVFGLVVLLFIISKFGSTSTGLIENIKSMLMG